MCVNISWSGSTPPSLPFLQLKTITVFFFCTFEMENVVDLGLHQTRGLNINAIYSKTNDEQTLRMLTHTTQNMRQL